MKKLIAVLTLFLAFSISANAQEKRSSSSTEKGKKEAAELTEYLGLTPTQNADFARLFEQKNSILETKDITQERKAELSRVIEDKIRASLNAEQVQMLDKNPELLKKLTH
ncbi:MAG TPA: hypothetical protein PKN96_02845 [Flavobacterium sp.]|uniref:hypothetical protein n=1 Tax=Flavobacterium sp. TaxID=239 RepID=UPI002B64F0BA|nr:hypothetical protein [Flavobacterium sp.]HNP32213.1 hypothetical protein [Flavobacterium sp.]